MLLFTPLSSLSLYIPSQPQRFSSSSPRGYTLHLMSHWSFYQRVQGQVGCVFFLGWHWGHCADSLTCVLVGKFNNILESTVAVAGNSVFSTHGAQRSTEDCRCHVLNSTRWQIRKTFKKSRSKDDMNASANTSQQPFACRIQPLLCVHSNLLKLLAPVINGVQLWQKQDFSC